MKTKDANEQRKALPAVVFDELRFSVPSEDMGFFAVPAPPVTSSHTLPKGWRSPTGCIRLPFVTRVPSSAPRNVVRTFSSHRT